MNKFQAIVLNRIKSLLLAAEMAGETEHGGTMGGLREKYITSFLRDMAPAGVSLTSGALFDSAGRVSPQMDLIATLDSILPTIMLGDGVSMVPVEAALMAIEIKSKLTKKALEQVRRHNEWINGVNKHKKYALPANPGPLCPTAILALDTDLGAENVSGWMTTKDACASYQNLNTFMCCVIGKFHLIKQGSEQGIDIKNFPDYP